LRSIGVLGGTGKQGRGLALRWALAGHRVRIGSRDPQRAAGAAEEVAERLKEIAGGEGEGLATSAEVEAPPGAVDSGDYAACTECDVVVAAVPYDGLDAAVEPLAEVLRDRVVVSCISPVTVDDDGPSPVPIADGSAAERLQGLAPGARVVGAFQNVAARKLMSAPTPMVGDIFITGEDPTAREVAGDLVRAVPDLRPVEVGPLRLSRPVEEITAVQMAINMRHKVVTSLRLEGLGD
jgi:NADPH-dependent F420 reductase